MCLMLYLRYDKFSYNSSYSYYNAVQVFLLALNYTIKIINAINAILWMCSINNKLMRKTRDNIYE